MGCSLGALAFSAEDRALVGIQGRVRIRDAATNQKAWSYALLE